MSETPSFARLVPGFEFLQTLAKNAGAALPGIGQWVAPTLNPDEIEKRISELRTVQFWLEQNARMLGATIQALEVQRMTLSTLKTMNVQMDDLRESLTIRVPSMAGASAASASASGSAGKAGGASTAGADRPGASKSTPAADRDAAARPGAVDPMQWWGALTNQFTQLATNAMKDSGGYSAGDAAKSAGSALQKSFDSAAEVFKAAAAPVVAATQKASAGFGAHPSSPATKSGAARKRAAPKSSRTASKRATGPQR